MLFVISGYQIHNPGKNIILKNKNYVIFYFICGAIDKKMRAAQKLFLILCQVYIYLQKWPRPLKLEDISKYLPPPKMKEKHSIQWRTGPGDVH